MSSVNTKAALPPALKAYIEANFHINNLNECLVILPKNLSDLNDVLNHLPDYTIAHINREPDTGDFTLNIHKDPIPTTVIAATDSTGSPITYEKELKTIINSYIDRLKQIVTTVDPKRKITWTQRHFISNLSHQVKTPLNSIISGVQLIEHYVKDEFVNRILEYMLQSSVELTSYINDIVDFYYMKKNVIELRLEPVNLVDTLDYIISIYEQQLIDSNIALDIQMDPKLPITVNLDAKRFTQVLINLIGNAVKYTEYAAGCQQSTDIDSMAIKISAVRRGSSQAMLTIQDTGTGGIDVSNQDKYFEPFYQIETAETQTASPESAQPIWLDAPDGLGLGLCISRYLITKMGGTVQFITPDPGFRTAVQITYPLDILIPTSAITRHHHSGGKPSIAKSRSIPQSLNTLTTYDIPKHHTINIDFVIIDDNSANLELLELILRDKIALNPEHVQYTVIGFIDPLAARDYILQNASNNMIVLADIKMPRLNGFSLVSGILDQVNSSNRPHFVYITALSQLDVTSKIQGITTLHSGCKLNVIYKPINIKTLETTIKTLINEIDYSTVFSEPLTNPVLARHHVSNSLPKSNNSSPGTVRRSPPTTTNINNAYTTTYV